jgi:eukaryotic-like serine/threonine-protein kinase
MSGHSHAGDVAEMAGFIPRQQLLRFKEAKPEVDVWATAASLYNMLTGKFPRRFRAGEDPWLTVLQHDPVPIRKRAQHVPDDLARVIDEALIDSPEIRVRSAAQLKSALEEAWQ